MGVQARQKFLLQGRKCVVRFKMQPRPIVHGTNHTKTGIVGLTETLTLFSCMDCYTRGRLLCFHPFSIYQKLSFIAEACSPSMVFKWVKCCTHFPKWFSVTHHTPAGIHCHHLFHETCLSNHLYTMTIFPTIEFIYPDKVCSGHLALPTSLQFHSQHNSTVIAPPTYHLLSKDNWSIFCNYFCHCSSVADNS